MSTFTRVASIVAALSLVVAGSALAEPGHNGLFLSKSGGYEHGCIKWDEQKISHVDRILQGIAKQLGINLLCTKDGGLLTADNLKKYDVVIFFTQGDLTTVGNDQQPAATPAGVEDLLAWIRNGGGFLGFHCASDTEHSPATGPVTPYLQMLGGEFRTHGAQFEGTFKVVDASHPAMAHVPAEWKIKDEWYMFRNFNPETMHVLALLDPGDERQNQEKYNVPSYPICWCSVYGKGRVYYNAMGHRDDVWDNATFQALVTDAVKWAMGEGPADATPNFNQVMTPEDAVKAQAEAPAPAK